MDDMQPQSPICTDFRRLCVYLNIDTHICIHIHVRDAAAEIRTIGFIDISTAVLATPTVVARS